MAVNERLMIDAINMAEVLFVFIDANGFPGFFKENSLGERDGWDSWEKKAKGEYGYTTASLFKNPLAVAFICQVLFWVKLKRADAVSFVETFPSWFAII